MPTSTSPQTQEQWTDKYKLPTNNPQSSPNITMYDFTSTSDIPPNDLEAAKTAATKEQSTRQQALTPAEKAKYKHLNMPVYTLRDGNKLPAVGLGTWKAEKGQVRSAVRLALQAGYRHIDCASVYQNEDEVGDALDYVLQKGLVKRNELFICSKVWNNEHSAAKVRAACLKSLKALKLSYLDLYLIHWPITGNVGPEVLPSIKETWQALEQLVDEGLVRSIGTSNFSAKKLADILTYARIPPSVCQVEIHPYHRNIALIQWCKSQGIHVTAFSPLGSPDSESIFPRKVPAVLLKDPEVGRIAKETGKNVGQVLIRWAIQNGTSVIPKSTNPDRIAGNVDVLDWELSEVHFKALSGFKFQQRMVNGAMFLNPKGPYRTYEELWDEAEDMDDEDAEVHNDGNTYDVDKAKGGVVGEVRKETKGDNWVGKVKGWFGGQ